MHQIMANLGRSHYEGSEASELVSSYMINLVMCHHHGNDLNTLCRGKE